MITRLLAAIVKPTLSLPFHRTTPAYPFVLLKILKKKLQQKQKAPKPESQTYSAGPQAKQKQKEEQQKQIFETEYDFFSRQKEIELNKDYRKIREESQFIPPDVGKGGFDEVVYWTQFAKTPQQVVDLVKVFNRIQMPEEIGDKIRFEAFGDSVMKTVYLSSNLSTLQEFATFGQKFNINDATFWRKIEQKTVRIMPKTPSQTKDCIQIAFLMSKMGQGQTIYSSLIKLFKDAPLTPEDKAKLLLVYANTETGQKKWVEELTKGLIDGLRDVRKEILVLALAVFKKAKNLPDSQERKIFERIQELLPELNFRELCIVGEFIGHGKMPQTFWQKLQTHITPLIPPQKPKYTTLHLLSLLSSYSLSPQFLKSHLLPQLRAQSHSLLHQLPPEILSSLSKTLYIYQLETQTKDIEQIIETNIMKVFNTIKNVQVQNLIKVVKDYTVTRAGARELYIFLEQVADAKFQDIRKNREHLQMLTALYENSQLCSPEFLKKLQHSL